MGLRSKILMVYPNSGFADALVVHAPWGLLYASIDLAKNGYDIEIIDTRLEVNSWKKKIKENIERNNIFACGISVMSGFSTKHAASIGRFIKSLDKEIKVVWGGSFASFFPQVILKNNWGCDYVVSGNGSKPFYRLLECIRSRNEPKGISGISYCRDGRIIQEKPEQKKLEFYNYREIPYHLIRDYSDYGQLDQDKRIFSIYSSLGCPYQCSFCGTPAECANIEGAKWLSLPAAEVVDHIEYLVKNYSANYIYFIDNDSFVDLSHVENILDEIRRRDISIGIGFRGARINEVKKMDAAYLKKLSDCNVDILHIGIESGSNRILKLMRKDCDTEDIINCNLKLSGYPRIMPAYNFLLLTPTENIDDLRSTRDLMLRLVRDNPRCIIFAPNKYRPLPGTELYRRAQEEWKGIDLESDFHSMVFPKKIIRYFNMLYLCSHFIDGKVRKTTCGGTLFYKVARIVCAMYKPIADLRIRHELNRLMIELWLLNIFSKLFRNPLSKRTNS